MRFLNNLRWIMFSGMLLLASCELINLPGKETEQQKLGKQLEGTWSNPSNVKVPIGGFNDIFDSMQFTFFIESTGDPSNVRVTGANEIFQTTPSSTWRWANSTTTSNIILFGVSPIEEINVSLSGNTLTMSFSYSGSGSREETIGTYSVTLTK